jgi:hypothetical protein
MTQWITMGQPGMEIEEFIPARFVRSRAARDSA